MDLVDHDHVVQAFPTYSSDDALSMAVLPWRSKACWSVPNTHRTNAPLEDATELHIIISDKVLGRRVPWKGFRNLLSEPHCRGLACNRQKDNLASGMGHDDEHVELFKQKSWDRK